MYRRLPLIILSLGVLLGRTALADKLTLTNSGQLTGTVKSVTFRHGATDTVHAGGSVASLDLRTTAGDELLLTGGTRITGALISLRFKTIGGVLPFERAKIAAVTISTSLPRRPGGGPATRPAAKASAKYDDRVKLTYGCEVRGMLMTAKMRIGKGTRTNLRGLIDGIELADDTDSLDSLLRPVGKKLEGRLTEVRFKTPLGTVSFTRDEIVSFKLRPASQTRPKQSVAGKIPKPTPGQVQLLAADEKLYEEHLGKVAEAEKRRLADLDKRHAETQKEIDELIVKAKAETAKWKREVAKRKEKSKTVDPRSGGMKMRLPSGSTVGMGTKRTSPQQQRLDAAKAVLGRLIRQKTVVTRQMEDARGHIRRSVIAAQKRLKVTRLKHQIIVLAGGTLTEAQMTSHYRADVGHGKTG